MKRVKMMLLSLLVLGVVAGSLAFKAKFNSDYCISPVRIVSGAFTCAAAGGGNVTCPNPFLDIQTITRETFNAWCTAPIDGDGNCTPAPNCNATVYSLDDDGGGQ